MSELTVYVDLDTTRVEAKEADWKGRIQSLNAELSKTELHTLRVTRKVFTAITSTIHAVTSVLRACGIALPASVQAMLASVTGIFWSLQAMVAAYIAGGVTAPYAMALEAAALGFNIATLGIVLATGQEVDARIRDGEAAIEGIAGAGQAWGRLITSWGE